jgi:ribosome maturation factor RimP
VTYAERIIAFAYDMAPIDQAQAVRRVVLSPTAFARLLHERVDSTGVDVTLFTERMLLRARGFEVEVTKSLSKGGDTRI